MEESFTETNNTSEQQNQFVVSKNASFTLNDVE